MKRILLIAALLLSNVAHSHSSDNSYLSFDLQENQKSILAVWKIPLKQLDTVLDLDINNDGSISWSDIQASTNRLTEYLFSSLTVRLDNIDCDEYADSLELERLASGLYLVLPFSLECHPKQTESSELKVHYQLMFTEDQSAQALFHFQRQETETTHVFNHTNQQSIIQLQNAVRIHFTDFVIDGIWHILIGFDHILFLATLLFPVALLKTENVLRETIKVVTAFTFAHSLTLSAAATDIVVLSPPFVEFIISLSIVVGALFSVRRRYDTRLWLLALAFGFIHGFGFANVLAEIVPKGMSYFSSLIAFNIGVELGQLTLVFMLFPLLMAIKRSRLSTTFTLQASMLIVGVCGMSWMVERTGTLLAQSPI